MWLPAVLLLTWVVVCAGIGWWRRDRSIDRPNLWKVAAGFAFLWLGLVTLATPWRQVPKEGLAVTLVGVVLVQPEMLVLFGWRGRRCVYTWSSAMRGPNEWKLLLCGTLLWLAAFSRGPRSAVGVAICVAACYGIFSELRQLGRLLFR